MEIGSNQFVSIDYLSLGQQTAKKFINKTNKREENLKLYTTKISYSNLENKISMLRLGCNIIPIGGFFLN